MSGHPRTHQNAILRTYAGLLLISICVYTLMYAPQPMFNSVSRDFGVDKGSTAARQRVHAVARRLRLSAWGCCSAVSACGVPFWGLPSCSV